MENPKAILEKCFTSPSPLWRKFLAKEEELITLYYPSAGEDLRPFVFSKKECIDYTGTKVDQSSYKEPNLFIFSDYFIGTRSQFFDTRTLHYDKYTQVFIEDFCELHPNKDNFTYNFNRDYTAFDAAAITGKAVFFKARIHSHVVEDIIHRYAIYFFYENVNLLDQLFLKHKFPMCHLVWKRDGAGLGGGRLRHDFLFPVSEVLNTEYFFIDQQYLKDEQPIISYDFVKKDRVPQEIEKYLPAEFSIKLFKKGEFKWDSNDRVNLYTRDH